MDARIVDVFPHNHTQFKKCHRRLVADDLFAWLTETRKPANRTERRIQAKRIRRMASAHRGEERAIQEKRAWRAWRKERRLALTA